MIKTTKNLKQTLSLFLCYFFAWQRFVLAYK